MDSEGRKRLWILLEDELPDSVASFQDEDVDVLYKKRCTSKYSLRHTDLQFLADDPDPLHPTLVRLLAHYRSRVGKSHHGKISVCASSLPQQLAYRDRMLISET